MIKKIIHCADIHIRNFQRHDEYAEQLTKFVEMCKEIASPYEKEEVRILISGDLVHQKNTISPELMSFCATFIRELSSIATVICIAGNHDLIVNNQSRKDAITSLFETAAFDNAYFLDYSLGFKSGTVVDDNITWALYSIYDGFNSPNIEEIREEHPNNTIVGLYHGMVVGATLHNGSVTESGVMDNIFEGCDFVASGDIHKAQTLNYKGTDIVYSGSLIQQTFGETVTQHGFVVWDVETNSHEFMELPSEYGLYDIEIDDIDDIKNDKERLKNL